MPFPESPRRPDIRFTRPARIVWNARMRPAGRIPFLLGISIAFSSCQDAPPAAPLVEPPPPAPARPAPPPVKTGKLSAIDVPTLFPLQQAGGVLIYDVRPGFVLSFGRIPGAISWPRREFARHLAAQEPRLRAAAREDRPVVLYCTDADCPDARAMADQLATRGHDVSVLAGGYAEWKEAGLPTE